MVRYEGKGAAVPVYAYNLEELLKRLGPMIVYALVNAEAL